MGLLCYSHESTLLLLGGENDPFESIVEREVVDFTMEDERRMQDAFDSMGADVMWMPYYIKGNWTTFEGEKRRITVCLLLLSGTSHSADRVTVCVEDDGMALVVRCKVPDVFNQTGLATLHSDEPLTARSRNDYHARVRALAACTKLQKQLCGGNITAVARIMLDHPCDISFAMVNKADGHGARILYVTLSELETFQESNPSTDWPVLQEDSSNEQ